MLGGEIHYFDMCSTHNMKIVELEAMLGELGISTTSNDLYMLTPDCVMPDGLLPVQNEADFEMMMDLVVYDRMQNIYVTAGGVRSYADFGDFSFTQMLEDDRVQRIDEIREEIEDMPLVQNDAPSQVIEAAEEFEGDLSNMDSSEDEIVPPPRRVRRIPPPNPPYRTRRRGRYSMLRVSNWTILLCSFCS